ncbi:MAG: tetratricopeptide repeat protein, partial [Spirochaetota bacterium]
SDAIAAYVELIKIDAKMWDAWYGLGQLQASSGDSASAKKTLGDLLAKNPSYEKKVEVQKILSGL